MVSATSSRADHVFLSKQPTFRTPWNCMGNCGCRCSWCVPLECAISSSLNITSIIAVIIVIVGVVAFYFRRRRIRRRLTDRIHSSANSTRDPEQGAKSPSFEKSPRPREMRGISDVDASIAKVGLAVCRCEKRLMLPLSRNVRCRHHRLAKVYHHLIIMKQRKNKERLNCLGTTGSPSDFPPFLFVRTLIPLALLRSEC